MEEIILTIGLGILLGLVIYKALETIIKNKNNGRN